VAARAETVPTAHRGKVASWAVTTDHKRIGILYIWTSLVFLLIAGGMAILFRIQLSQANAHFIGPERYNELITFHGTAMVFLVGAAIQRYGSLGVPVAATAIVFVIGLVILPFAVETRGKALPG